MLDLQDFVNIIRLTVTTAPMTRVGDHRSDDRGDMSTVVLCYRSRAGRTPDIHES